MSANAETKRVATAKPEPFGKVVLVQLSEAERSALRRVRWLDRLTSLWAPITVFGLVFAVYVVIVESSVCTYLWLQMPLKIFGLAMFTAWVGLVASRFGARRFTAERKARGIYEELLTEVETLVDKNRAQLSPKAVDELASQAAALVRGLGALDSPAQERSAKELSASVDKQLAKWRAGGAGDFAGGFVKALAVALLIRTVLVEPFKIPSGSLIPTLEIGDQIFVNKFIYGVRIPFADKVLFQIVRSPKRGDIVVFYNRLVGKDFIKRVVAVPGDHVQIRDRQVVINGKAYPSTLEAEHYEHWDQSAFNDPMPQYLSYAFRDDWRRNEGTLEREVIDGQPHLALYTGAHESFDIDVVVPERAVFVMGDNRDNSADSRLNFGASLDIDPATGKKDMLVPFDDSRPGNHLVQFVPFDSIKGKATVIWLSLSHGGLLSSVFGGTGLRTDRFFTPVTMCGSEAPRQ